MTAGLHNSYQAIAIGASAGGLYALTYLFEILPAGYPIPLIVVQHRSNDQKELLEEVLQQKCKIAIKQADEKEKIEGGHVYIAPPGYHLLVETDLTFSLSTDKPVLFSRPSINVFFETAADAFKQRLVGLILTGSNCDGASGMRRILSNGGLTIAQHPKEAQFPLMPKTAIDEGVVKYIWTLNEIRRFLLTLTQPVHKMTN